LCKICFIFGINLHVLICQHFTMFDNYIFLSKVEEDFLSEELVEYIYCVMKVAQDGCKLGTLQVSWY